MMGRPAMGAPDLAEELRNALSRVHWRVRSDEVGRIARVGDGVAAVTGLPSVRYQELVAHKSGAVGVAYDLLPDEVGVLLLDPAETLYAGDEMRATGRFASIPVSRQVLGRVVDPLGRPLDGGPAVGATQMRPIECEAPGVAQRAPVREPLHTGATVVDALLPLGRGQRELILGDRGTGKTALAIDVPLSVSRVGGKAQLDAMKAISGDLRLLYAQLRELETFVRFGGAELEPGARNRLLRGRILREVFRQRRLAPLRPGHEVAILLAVCEGHLDGMPVESVGAFVKAFEDRLDREAPAILSSVERGHGLGDSDRAQLAAVAEAVRRPYLQGGGGE